jgi:myo-inositol-1(or 4)-monophosphatase
VRVDDDPLALVELARTLAAGAAELIVAGRRAGLTGVSTKSSATDMVTEYDRRSERYIVERLHEMRPDDALVGEEGTSTTGTTGLTWLIDPIDGTTNYLYGLAGYAVSVAVADGHGPLAGAVAIPALGELFSAARGHGARCNDAPVRCSTTVELATALVATGFSYQRQRRRAQAVRVAGLIDQVRDIRRIGAAAGDLCYCAAGRVDIYFEEHLNPWDLAAGEIIAREAGCRVGDLRGGPVRADSVLVAPPALFEPMVELLAGLEWAEPDLPEAP